MRGGVAGQNSDVHPDTFTGEPKEPFHGRAGTVCSARCGLAARTDSTTYYAAGTVHEVAVTSGMRIGVLVHDREMSMRGFVRLVPSPPWACAHDLGAAQKT